ncbi:unnamed protein product [Fusarium venenatum]|uniref:Uncharacterized protein n=1 Tax=Fusarium venenatum TaxID=56646 RepID=A0A2L2TA90_9HYPO|nr:uncharacterized protein FVRRES_03311 [Fusarium venenatum]CEI66799.1 unnamed protein product [Fusarium venenatum]
MFLFEFRLGDLELPVLSSLCDDALYRSSRPCIVQNLFRNTQSKYLSFGEHGWHCKTANPSYTEGVGKEEIAN